jgi:ABC-type Fe3+/spermidine/putrescine transport system ATPase subunit
MVTHDQEEVLYLADELLVLESGRIRQIGTPADVYRNPDDVFVAGFMGASNIWEGTIVVDRGRPIAQIDGVSLPLPIPGGRDSGGEIAAGRSVVVSVRPESIALGPANAADGAAAPMGSLRIPAVIEEVEYVGATTRVRLRLGKITAVSLQLARAVADWREGAEVSALIEPGDIKYYVAMERDAK